MFDTKGANESWARFQFKSGSASRRRVYIKLAKLLENGVKIIDAITTMRDRRVRLHGKNDPMVMAMGVWAKRMSNGSPLSEAVAGWVPAQERMMIAAGERSGKLEDALLSNTEVMEAQAEIRSAIIGGVSYPAMLVMLAFGMLYLFGYKLVPAFGKMVPDDKWTGAAAAVVWISHWVQDWLWLPAMLVLVMTALCLWAMPNWVGPARVKLDSLPPFSIYRLTQGSSWIISLAAMVETGERIEDAVKTLGKNSSRWLSSRNTAILNGLRSGHNIGDAMVRAGTGFPDPDVIDDMAVYATVGGIDQALKMVSREWIKESVESIRSKMKLFFNVGIVTVGLVVGFMVSGLISMQLQMGQILKHGI